MAIDVGTAIAYLNLDATNFNTGLSAAQSALQDFEKNGVSLSNSLTGVGTTLANTGYNLTKHVTVPLVNLGQSALQNLRDYESAFTGVKKTIDDTDLSKYGITYEQLSDAIEKMATETASSVEEISGVMEMAGQLGIPLGEAGQDITKFTKTMVMLGDTTNIEAQEAALALAKFMNITGTAASDSDRLGAAIVDLGNNFATQEDQIVNMSTRMASAGTIAGLTSQEILALATSMSSAGIRAEAGGSAMATTLTNIEQIVQGVAENSESKLQELAKVSGMSAEDFAETWENEPIVALTAFLHGLGDLDEQGESAVVTLDKLGMKGVRQSNMLKALALSAEKMDDALYVSNKAWEDNTALIEEADKRYATLDSKISQLNERWKAMKRDIAELLIPVLERLMDILEKIIKWWNSLSDAQKESIVRIAEYAALLGPFLVLLGRFLTTIGNIIKMVQIIHNLISSGSGIISAIGKIGSGIASFIKTISGIGLVITGIITAVKSFFDMLSNGFSWIKEGLMVLGIALTAIGAIILGAPAAVAGVIAGIVAAIATLVIVIKDHWTEITEWCKKVWEGFKEWWVSFWTAVGDFFKEIWNSIKEWWNSFWTGLLDVINSFVSGIKKWWNDVTDFIKNKVKDIFDTVTTIVKNIYNTVKEILTNIFNTIKNIISSIWNTIKDILSNIWNTIKDTLTKIFNTIKDVLTKVFNTIKEVLTNVFNTIKNIIQNIWNHVVQFLQSLWNHITSWFNTLISSITSWLSNLWSNIVSWFTNLVSSIISWLQNLWSNIVTWFTNLINNITQWFSQMWNQIVTWFTNLISSIANYLVTVWNNVTDWLSNVLNKLINWFADLKDRFVNWGKNILSGLWEGLKSVWNSIASWFQDKFAWVGNIVSGIKNAVSSVLGFGNKVSGINGSHANGLDYVPFNGYTARLHEGERVLTKQENKEYEKNDKNSGGDTFIFNNVKDDPYEYARQIKRTKKELAFN